MWSWQYPKESTVVWPNHTPKAYILPYGFVQSVIIASFCLHKSALGRYLNKLGGSGFKVSVYMDDIIVSTSLPIEQAEAALEELKSKATREVATRYYGVEKVAY